MSDTSNFNFMDSNTRKRAALSQYGATSAKNAYSQFLAQQRGNRQVFDINKQYEQAAPGVVNSFTKRGLAGPGIQSGIFSRSLNELAKQKTENINASQMDTAGQNQQFALDSAGALDAYNAQFNEEEFNKQNNIANTAANLTAWKPFLGG